VRKFKLPPALPVAGPERESLGEIARLVAVAAGFSVTEGNLGAQIVAQNLLHRGGPEIIEQVFGEDTDRGGRIAQRGVEPAAVQRVGGGITGVGLRADNEGRKFDGVFLAGGRRRGRGGKNYAGQERGQGCAAQQLRDCVHGVVGGAGILEFGW
jgi:hypothetical protein